MFRKNFQVTTTSDDGTVAAQLETPNYDKAAKTFTEAVAAQAPGSETEIRQTNPLRAAFRTTIRSTKR